MNISAPPDARAFVLLVPELENAAWSVFAWVDNSIVPGQLLGWIGPDGQLQSDTSDNNTYIVDFAAHPSASVYTVGRSTSTNDGGGGTGPWYSDTNLRDGVIHDAGHP